MAVRRGLDSAQHDATGLSGTRTWARDQSAGQPGRDVTQSGAPRHSQPTRAQSGGIPRTAAPWIRPQQRLIRWPTVVEQ